jgi:hypothetical protein
MVYTLDLQERIIEIWLRDLNEIPATGSYVLDSEEVVLTERRRKDIDGLIKVLSKEDFPFTLPGLDWLITLTRLLPMNEQCYNDIGEVLGDYVGRLYEEEEEAAEPAEREPVQAIPGVTSEPSATPDIEEMLLSTSYTDAEIARLTGRSRQRVNRVKQALIREGRLGR